MPALQYYCQHCSTVYYCQHLPRNTNQMSILQRKAVQMPHNTRNLPGLLLDLHLSTVAGVCHKEYINTTYIILYIIAVFVPRYMVKTLPEVMYPLRSDSVSVGQTVFKIHISCCLSIVIHLNLYTFHLKEQKIFTANKLSARRVNKQWTR